MKRTYTFDDLRGNSHRFDVARVSNDGVIRDYAVQNSTLRFVDFPAEQDTAAAWRQTEECNTNTHVCRVLLVSAFSGGGAPSNTNTSRTPKARKPRTFLTMYWMCVSVGSSRNSLFAAARTAQCNQTWASTPMVFPRTAFKFG